MVKRQASGDDAAAAAERLVSSRLAAVQAANRWSPDETAGLLQASEATTPTPIQIQRLKRGWIFKNNITSTFADHIPVYHNSLMA